MYLFRNWQDRMLRDKANPEGGEGGAGAGNPDPKDDIATLKASNEALLKRLEELEKKHKANPDPKDEPDDLSDKARKEREEKDKQNQSTKNLEKALKFNMTIAEWTKTNAILLPKSIEGIVTQAEKENYGTESEKADAIKVGLVSEFFAVQSNQDLLTEGQKNQLDEFRKLTKNEKQARVQNIYDNIFEPTFENLKRVEKAKQVSKGYGEQNDSQDAYKQKLVELSTKKYLKKGV